MSETATLLADLRSRGGDVEHLCGLTKEALQPALKALGFSKLGDRVRVAAVLKAAAVPVTAEEPTVAAEAVVPPSAAAPFEAPDTVSAHETTVEDGPSTMVMHGAVQDIYDDGGLLKTTLKAGHGKPPPPLSKVKVRYVASVLPECRRFEATVMSFQMGEHQVPRGLEKCTSTMLRGETCELLCRAEYAYGNAGRLPDVPSGASVRYEVELISFEAPRKEGFERTAEDNYDEAVTLKTEGTAAFSSGLWLEAQVCYHKATRLLLTEYEELIRPIGKQPHEVRDLMVACELNIAQCALKREEWFIAEKVCTEVLERLADPMGKDREQNLKALFRRSKARVGRSDFKGARADAKAANVVNPNSREVRELWNAIKDKEETSTASEEKVYARMTSKLMYKEYNIGKKRHSAYPRVFFDVTLNGDRLPRIIFELFTDRAPKTCENFRALCTGEKGTSEHGTRLHYKGSRFHRALNCDDAPPEFVNESADGTGRLFEVWKGFLLQGGDIVNGDGTGGESIFGEPFDDEFSHDYVRFTVPGLLAMAGSVPMREKAAEEMMHIPNNNTSQFFITTKARNHAQGGMTILHFDGRHVVFGKVVEGMGSIHKMQKAPHDPAQGHYINENYPVIIADCGELKSKEEVEHEREQREFERLNPEFMIKDREEDAVAEAVSRATWAAVGEEDLMPPRPPPQMPTAADEAIISAEVDDDD